MRAVVDGLAARVDTACKEKAAQVKNATSTNTVKNYAASATIKTKFDSVDTILANEGELKVGSAWFQVRSTPSTTDIEQFGYITTSKRIL